MIPLMRTVDTEQERKRLANLYSGMNDGELERLAEDLRSLTDVALVALMDELARRGLNVVSEESPSQDDVEPLEDVEQIELVTVRSFEDKSEALLAKGLLESAGIESFMANDSDMTVLDWFNAPGCGVIKLQVNAEDAKLATEVLATVPGDSEAEE
jgi:hypothetical protein